MKIITLIPLKNEEAYIPTFLSNVKSVTDEIIAIDDNSTDNSVKLLKKAGVKVYKNDLEVESGWAELGIRERLLRLGRDHAGTHFIVLDADETFTGQFANYVDKVCSALKPGHKARMQWLAMWKSVDHYRDDSSVWSNNFKDFIFCDDGKIEYPKVWMHTPRTPGPTTDDNCLPVNPKYGAVLHFQFSDWETFQIKQAWYRCSEFLKQNGTGATGINQKYSITKDDPNATVTALPEEWKKGVIFPDISYETEKNNWRLEQIKKWFKEYGPNYFKQLNIWHVPEIINIVQS